MSSNPIRLKYLFDKYLQNSCSKTELQEFWQLLSQLSENDLISEEMLRLWDRPPRSFNPAAAADGEKIYENIFTRAQEQEIDYHKLHRRRRNPAAIALGIAATLLLCLGLAWWAREKTLPQGTTPVAVAPAAQPPYRVLTLPDGTTALLNSHSRLDYPPAFSGKTRDVYLSGEAYFQVKQRAGQPFRVHTGNVVTTVLGTTFNIKAWPGERDISVTVTSGKVQVSSRQRTLGILQQNSQLIVDRESGRAIRKKVDTKEAVQWKSRDLAFHNITLEEAIAILCNHYDADIRLGNERLRSCRFTGTFLSYNDLEQVLDVITSITGTSWKKEGAVIRIEGHGCIGSQ